MTITLYVQKGCSKSEEVLRLLENTRSLHVVDMTQYPPSPLKLKELARKIGVPLLDVLRTDNALLGYDRNTYSESDLAVWMSEHPESIQRPIIESDASAMIARPPETAARFISLLNK